MSRVINFKKTLIHRQENLPPPTLCQNNPTKAERLLIPERKELESEIKDCEQHGQEKPKRDNLAILNKESTLSKHGKVLKFDRGVSEDVLEVETKGNKQSNMFKEECSNEIKDYSSESIIKEYSNEIQDKHQWNAIKKECRDKTYKREFQ